MLRVGRAGGPAGLGMELSSPLFLHGSGTMYPARNLYLHFLLQRNGPELKTKNCNRFCFGVGFFSVILLQIYTFS